MQHNENIEPFDTSKELCHSLRDTRILHTQATASYQSTRIKGHQKYNPKTVN